MSYTPTTWATGDVITAEKLDKMENGIAGALDLFVPLAFDGETFSFLEATYNDIKAILDNDQFPCFAFFAESGNGFYLVTGAAYNQNDELYIVAAQSITRPSESAYFTAASPDDIPVVEREPA